LFLLLWAAFEAFLSEFLVVGMLGVFKVGSTVNWWWDRCADVEAKPVDNGTEKMQSAESRD
jgi:hypothetical protein